MNGADKKGWSAGLGFVLLAYAASRLFYLLAGAMLARVVPVSAFYRITSDAPFGTMNLWSHWDGEHYVALAAGGYLQPPENVSPAFFPLYPLLARSFAEMFGGPASLGALGVWGVLVSLLALPFALYFVYKIAEHARDAATARRTVLVLAFFPTSFFFNAVYTESLFLALSAGSLWAVRVRKDLLLACLLAGLATATRNVGLFLLVPLALEWFGDRHAYRWRGAYLALAPGGLIAYGAYLWLRFGNPFLFYTDQAKWGREAAGSWRSSATPCRRRSREPGASSIPASGPTLPWATWRTTSRGRTTRPTSCSSSSHWPSCSPGCGGCHPP